MLRQRQKRGTLTYVNRAASTYRRPTLLLQGTSNKEMEFVTLSIGELIREKGGEGQARRILGWTGLIGGALFLSAMAGWFLLRNLSRGTLGLLVAAGAGAMFYLTMTELVPEAESHQFQQSSAIAAATGLLVIFTLSHLAR